MSKNKCNEEKCNCECEENVNCECGCEEQQEQIVETSGSDDKFLRLAADFENFKKDFFSICLSAFDGITLLKGEILD